MIKQRKKVLKSAAQWFARSRSEDFTPSDQAQLDAWLSASAENRAAYTQVSQAWDKSVSLDPVSVERLRPCSGFLNFRPVFQLVGYGLVFLFVLSSVFFKTEITDFYTSVVGQEQTYYTLPCQIQKISLWDGSLLEVNGNSAVLVYQDRWERTLKMKEGEFFLQVRPDPKRPFIVETLGGQIKVLGTRFHVCSRHGQVAVNVQQGRVQVLANPSGLGVSGKQILFAGQGVDYSWAGNLEELRSARLEEVLAWREGKIIFRSARLEDVVQKLEAFHKVRIILAPELQNRLFTGTFSSQDLDEILETIIISFGLNSRKTADGSWILGL